ncbi:MAG TPA: hypothetical protein VGJ77_19650 [Gaiellaceae bacterium]|jgi:hypothetical protein
MRRSTLVVAAAVAALAAAPAGDTKEGAGGSVCGTDSCAHVSAFSLQLAGSYRFYRHVAPAPYFVVRIELPPNVFIPGTHEPILYLPRTGLWRVTIDGLPVWLDVPRRDAPVLREAVRNLRPFAAPRSWAAAATR